MVVSKVLVPVDGSPASLRALDFAIEMMGQHSDTSLVLLNVQNISAMDLAGAAMGSDWQEAASQASDRALKEAVGKAQAAGMRLRASSEPDRRRKRSPRQLTTKASGIS